MFQKINRMYPEYEGVVDIFTIVVLICTLLFEYLQSVPVTALSLLFHLIL